VRWTREPQLHLTLKFLGEQDAETAAAVAARVGEVARRHAPLTLEIAGLGAFPNRTRPRVVWAGVVPDPKLELLHHDVELACAALGLPVEGRAFRPHLTLGRVGRSDAAELQSLAVAARAAHVAVSSLITTVDLMSSELTSRGAQHACVAAAPLGGA
jgi:2'-5' RNA ligase